MIWKEYSHLKNTHAFLSPSKYFWLQYPEDKLVESYKNFKRISLGTQYHELASNLIRLAVRLPNNSVALNSFVNDAIGFGMASEVLLYYSMNCYGTCDAIVFSNGILRIHDLKTGRTPGSIDQLLIYAGLFCLNYEVDPLTEIQEVYLRIYFNDEIIEFRPHPKDILDVVNRIIVADRVIKSIEDSVL